MEGRAPAIKSLEYSPHVQHRWGTDHVEEDILKIALYIPMQIYSMGTNLYFKGLIC